MTATVPRVARPRGELTADQKKRVAKAEEAARRENAAWRQAVIDVLLEGASFSEVSKFTGLSTNTLQRWKREAGK